MSTKFPNIQLLLTALSLAVYSTFATAALTLPTQSVTISPISSQATLSDSYVGTVTAANQLEAAYVSASDFQQLSFAKFSESTGVLTDALWQLKSLSGTVTFIPAATKGTGTANRYDGRGFITANIEGVQFGSSYNDNLKLERRYCTSTIACFNTGETTLKSPLSTTSSNWGNTSATNGRSAAPNTLDNYIGAGSLQANLEVKRSVHLEPYASPVGTLNVVNPGISMGLAGFTGTASLTYSYLKHANASFTTGTDTNQIAAEVTDLPLSFSVFNLGDANTTKLDKVSVSCVGDCDDFQLTLPSMQDLVAGGSGIAGGITRIGDGAGSATYTLIFSDDTALGASASRLQNSLSVSVAAVPEPAEWAMLLAGLLVVGFIARRRNEMLG